MTHNAPGHHFGDVTIHGIAMLLVDGPLKPAGGDRRGGPANLAEGTIKRAVHAVTTFGGIE